MSMSETFLVIIKNDWNRKDVLQINLNNLIVMIEFPMTS